MSCLLLNRIPVIILAGAVFYPVGLLAQAAQIPSTAIASRVDTPPSLDGEVLSDPVWESVSPVSDFWQITPDEGEPASERTEVRIVYTVNTLYFGVICYDRTPDSIIVSDSRRDAPLDETDSFQIILDTYLDQQNGFVFGTNPAGIEYDGQVANEGLANDNPVRAQTGGSGGGFNINWDASWEVKTQISSIGWSAEFAIPFRTLRFSKRSSQTWGLNFQRNIRCRNETAFWSPLPRQFNLYRLSLAGNLTHLEISTPRNLKLIPYTLGEVRKQQDRKTNWLGTVGGDLKYSVTPSLTLDVTYNTDFAQVEVDEQQINLDRFDLFFPEKRPFFLENAGLFAVGEPEEVELFFSRRIGIGPEGEIIPIVAGARLTGKLGGTNIGFLNMQTEEAQGVTPANNFTVARASRELPNRFFLGAIFVNRQGTGDLAPDRDHNQTYGVDGRWGIGEYGEVSGFAARTSTPDSEEGQSAYRIGTSYNSAAWLLRGSYMEVAQDFNPEVGFLQRTEGFRKPSFRIWHRYRPQNLWGLHELRPHILYRGYWNFEGFQESGFLHLDNHWEWKNGHEIHTGINLTRVRSD